MKIILLLILISGSLVFAKHHKAAKKHHSKSQLRHKMRTSTGMKADPIPVNLPDVTQTGQRDFEDIVNVFSKHHVSRGEVKVIFKTADINEDNMISIQEWGDFHGLFIEPFEEADSGGEYLLD